MKCMENKTKYIFLSGGGGSDDSVLLDKEFIKELRVHKKLLYIPVAMDQNFLTYESCYDWIIKTIGDISDDFIDIVMWTDLKNKKIDDLSKFDAIYIGGGNTFNLLQVINDTSFIQPLKDFILSGGVVYGGSAGAIILGKSINTVSEENDNNYHYEDGLDVINGYSIICHYQGSLDKKIIEYIEKYKNPVIALPERTGLIVGNKQAAVYGFESAVLFEVSMNKKKLSVGSTLPL